MRIGISQRVEVVPSYGEQRDCLDQQWFRFLEAMGYTPVPIPNSLCNLKEWLESMGVEGLILSGGNDLSHLSDASNASKERDETERTLLTLASELRLPVIGVCRGLQMMNVWLGGQLVPVAGHAAVRHPVTPDDLASDCFRLYLEANSFHNWGISPDGLAADLMPQIFSTEGDVEACRHRSLPWAGIMWHPEREVPFTDQDKQLFNFFFRGTPCKH